MAGDMEAMMALRQELYLLRDASDEERDRRTRVLCNMTQQTTSKRNKTHGAQTRNNKCKRACRQCFRKMQTV